MIVVGGPEPEGGFDGSIPIEFPDQSFARLDLLNHQWPIIHGRTPSLVSETASNISRAWDSAQSR
jgi:hypothetical protein